MAFFWGGGGHGLAQTALLCFSACKHGAHLQLHHSFHEPSHNCRCLAYNLLDLAHNHAVLVSENGRNLLLNGAACVCMKENVRNPTIPKASPGFLS